MSKKVKITAVVVVMLLAMCAVLAACGPTTPESINGVYAFKGMNVAGTFVADSDTFTADVAAAIKANPAPLIKQSIETNIEYAESEIKGEAAEELEFSSEEAETAFWDKAEELGIDSWDSFVENIDALYAVSERTEGVDAFLAEIETLAKEGLDSTHESIMMYTSGDEAKASLSEAVVTAIDALAITDWASFTANLDGIAAAYALDTEYVQTNLVDYTSMIAGSMKSMKMRVKLADGAITAGSVDELTGKEQVQDNGTFTLTEENEFVITDKDGKISRDMKMKYVAKDKQIVMDYNNIEVVFGLDASATVGDIPAVKDGNYKVTGVVVNVDGEDTYFDVATKAAELKAALGDDEEYAAVIEGFGFTIAGNKVTMTKPEEFEGTFTIDKTNRFDFGKDADENEILAPFNMEFDKETGDILSEVWNFGPTVTLYFEVVA